MKIHQVMCYYAICAICTGFFGYLVGKTKAPRPVDPVETLFELCWSGAHLIKDGVPYIVVCVPVNSGKIGE